jgi:hypothetical protein
MLKLSFAKMPSILSVVVLSVDMLIVVAPVLLQSQVTVVDFL